MSIEIDSVGVKYAQQVTTRIRTRIASIREGVDRLEELLHEARTGNVHLAMGFTSWTAYLAFVFQDNPVVLRKPERRELVNMLSGEGMSTRAIGTIAGVDQKTVVNDLRAAEENSSTAEPTPTNTTVEQIAAPAIIDAEIVEESTNPTDTTAPAQPTAPATVTGLDGKTYSKKPKPVSYIAKAKAAVTAMREAVEKLDDAKQERLPAEVQLTRAEALRRAERAVGIAVRRAQDAGEVGRKGDGLKQNGTAADKPSPREFFRNSSEWTEINAMTETVSDVQFDTALDEARAEGNISRHHVIEKIKAAAARPDTDTDAPKTRAPWAETAAKVRELAEQHYTTRQIAKSMGISETYVKRTAKEFDLDISADKAVGRTRRHDSNRIVEHTVSELDSLVSGLELVDVDYTALDAELVPAWVESLSKSIRALNRFQKEISKVRSTES